MSLLFPIPGSVSMPNFFKFPSSFFGFSQNIVSGMFHNGVGHGYPLIRRFEIKDFVTAPELLLFREAPELRVPVSAR